MAQEMVYLNEVAWKLETMYILLLLGRIFWYMSCRYCIDCIIQLFNILDDFLSSNSITSGKQGGVETPTIIVGMVISSFSLIRFCFMYFEIQLFGCVHIKDCYVLLADLSFYHHVISSMSLIFFALKSTLSDIVASGMHTNMVFFF